MGRLIRFAPLAVVAAAAGAAAVFLVGISKSGGAATSSRLAATATLSPREALFGDPITARVEVRGADPRQLRVSVGFGPLDSSRPSVERDGDLVRYTYRLQCLRAACLPVGRRRRFVLPPVRVDDGVHSILAAWPTVLIGSRLTPGDRASPIFRVPQPAATTVDPTALGWSLAGLAVALLVAASLAVAGWLARRAGGRGFVLGPLERALQAVAAALRAGPEERRKALDSLALALDGAGHDALADRARTLAWSEPEPAPPVMSEVAAEARRACAEAG